MSHTISVKVELRNREALESAVMALGGRVLGNGTYHLYGGSENGTGFTLPGWRYPLVATDSGELKFDSFGGAWGDESDLDRLKEYYALDAVRLEAERLGWYCEPSNTGGLLVHHPSGGTLSVTSSGAIDAAGFMGGGCDAASQQLEAALGRRVGQVCKPEYNLHDVEVRATESGDGGE